VTTAALDWVYSEAPKARGISLGPTAQDFALLIGRQCYRSNLISAADAAGSVTV
jgi:hypothetical protein